MEKLKIKINRNDCNMLMHVIDMYFPDAEDYIDFFNLKSLYNKLLLKSFKFNGYTSKELSIQVNINEFNTWKILYNHSYNYLQAANIMVLLSHRKFFEQLDKEESKLKQIKISIIHTQYPTLSDTEL